MSFNKIFFLSLSLLPQAPEVDAVACGSFKKLDPPDIKATGYIVRSLEAVLWAFHHTSNFKDGCLKVGEGEVTKILHNHAELCTLLRIDNVFFAAQRSSSVVSFNGYITNGVCSVVMPSLVYWYTSRETLHDCGKIETVA